MSKGSYLHVVGCVFVARPGECGTHHDVLVWTPVNAHIILRRICHFAFDMFSATGTFVCFVHLLMAPVRGMHLTEVAVGVMHARSVELASHGSFSLASFFQFFSRPLKNAIALSVLLVHVSSSLAS